MAYQGIDLRDLFRRGSGMTLRRLGVLIEALPHDAPLWAEMRAAHEASLKATPELIRARQQAFYDRQRAKGA